MIAGNVGGDGVVQSEGSLYDHMAAFDQLPPSVRKKLSGMSINWNGQDVLNVMRSHGEDIVLRLLDKTEADVQGAYRNRLASAADARESA